MASVLHGCARTTPRVRAELQASQDKTSVLSPALRAEPDNGGQVARSQHYGRCPYGAARRPGAGAVADRGSGDRRVQAKNLLPLDDVLGCGLG